ncbi:hypothetical protein AB205_0134770 [Aquarana catesbeiana]|uniref:Myotubularin phosphatase domain-containing protein n=1 Tax=Aquarana catesbeiana TaxID=8400 RepID=A0A2G9RLR7_AQUCT|nr:hypothetical protein AB205_0134770 [Aquarana catesbeiana]
MVNGRDQRPFTGIRDAPGPLDPAVMDVFGERGIPGGRHMTSSQSYPTALQPSFGYGPVEQVKLLDRFSPSNKSSSGTLYLTATHLLFIDSQQKEIWVGNLRYADIYAFSYNPKQNEKERILGWQCINLKEEYQRMGVPNSYWQLSDVNRDYKVCETYPRELYVPITASKPIIVGSSKFRSKGRFPVLSYYHQETQAAICRCSQPLSGFSARCLEDEHMLQSVSKANPGCRSMYVMDTRPKLNAMANRAAGKGYENADNYSNIKFQFVGIENIHVMRSSLQKLLEVCGSKNLSVNDFFNGLENCGWLRHIKAVMDASVCLAKAIYEENTSVLVHCSDGWDRTSQVCALGSLLMDSFYRTIKGFMVLIEKDWISFGHKFSDRCGQLYGDSKEVSPVFTQFLECVWHLTEQFPQAFEFNEAFLLHIHEHEKTHSLWAHLLGERSKYQNPLFDQSSLKSQPVLEPNTIHSSFKFWRNMYHQFDLTLHPRQSVANLLVKISAENKALEDELKQLQLKMSNLTKGGEYAGNSCISSPTTEYINSPTTEYISSPTTESPKLKESPCYEKEQVLHPLQDPVQTIDGNTAKDNRYTEYSQEPSKEEPSFVSLECGVAKMRVS